MFNKCLSGQNIQETEHVSFPSIEHFRSFLKELRREYRNTDEKDLPESFTLVGTVKLHGTHADIVYKRRENDIVYKRRENDIYDVWCQSRNRVISVESDNCGFAAFVNNLPEDVLKSIFAVVENVFQSSGAIEEITDLIVSGEFCGGNIQKKVALEKLEKCFVIYDIKINGERQDFSRYEHLQFEDYRIYNIYRGGKFTAKMTLADSEAVVPLLQKITDDVEKECPFAKSLGISGVGEGVVWKCVLPSAKDDSSGKFSDNSRFWFKVKGKEHPAGKVKTLKVSKDASKIKNTSEFVAKAILTPRLEQGLDYLREMNLEANMKNLGTYLKWVVQDVFKEEGDVVFDLGLDEKSVKSAITQKAKQYYLKVAK